MHALGVWGQVACTGWQAQAMAVVLPAPLPLANASLEELAFYYGTDKAHDDHKYTDVYAMLFDALRLQVRNVTEIGVAAGQSLDMWHHYFPRAHLWGLDIILKKPLLRRFREKPRVSLRLASSTQATTVPSTARWLLGTARWLLFRPLAALHSAHIGTSESVSC